MLKVRFRNYINDYTKYDEIKSFYTLDELKSYLKREVERRGVSRTSVWWSNPCGAVKYNDGRTSGWFRMQASSPGEYRLWLKQVETADGVIVFQEDNYCSPKMYEFFRDLKAEFEAKPVYGDL